jgi:hypothetical protein
MMPSSSTPRHRRCTLCSLQLTKTALLQVSTKKISYYQAMRTRCRLARRLMSNWLVSTSWNLSTNRNCWLKILGCQYSTKKNTTAVHFASWSFINGKRYPFCLRKPVISTRSIDFTILFTAGDWAIISPGRLCWWSENRSVLTLNVLE